MPRTSWAFPSNSQPRSNSINPVPYTEERYSLSDSLKQRIGGEAESVFRLIENRFSVQILTRHAGLTLRSKDAEKLRGAILFLDQLKLSLYRGADVSGEMVAQMLDWPQGSIAPRTSEEFSNKSLKSLLRNKLGQPVQAKTQGQARLVEALDSNDLVFVNGPAGTGKTFLAVALAVSWLEEKRVERICLVRPAVEAGETLGFLPGDLKEKIAPYLRPMYDTLNELLPAEKMRQYHENNQIEVAPLAYMRGRTLKRAFIILDEAQNTTVSQMKMFLTRIGTHSKAIIAGDSTQSDLDARTKSGFSHAIGLLGKIDGIAHVEFVAKEALRHRLVQDILDAYEAKKSGRS